MCSAAVAAVVVTFNRKDLLGECLAALRAQTVPPSRIVVIDNASTDGTDQYLASLDSIEVVSLRHNTGGAGGFAAGIATALSGPADAIWLLDDDTIPTPTALAELLRVREVYPCGSPEVVASRVVWTDGRDHPMNTPRTRPGATRAALDAAAGVGCRPIRSASFVSILIDRSAVERHGLPEAAYFLWNDDFEYTMRLLRSGVGLYCPASVVVHKTRTFGSTDADPGERFFYEVRNKLWVFTRSDALTMPERFLYGMATVRRWARTFSASTDRSLLWSSMVNGLVAGRHAPPSTDMILRGARPLPGSVAASALTRHLASERSVSTRDDVD
jgi:GT2 family glycosyltransferase